MILIGLYCLVGLLAAYQACASASPSVDAPLSTAEIESSWRITPLGPEGADIAQLFLLPEGKRLALTTAGSFHMWVPLESPFRSGMWQPVDLARFYPGGILLAQAIDDGRSGPFVLLRSGQLLKWLEPEEWPARSLPEDDGRVLCAEARSRGFFYPLGELPPQIARRVVALLPGEDSRELRVVALTRHGEFYDVAPDRSQSAWQLEWRVTDDTTGSREERLRQITQAVVLGEDPRRVFILTKWDGLFVSHDHGKSVEPIGGDVPIEVSTLSVTGSDELCAVTPDGLLTTQVGATDWKRWGPLTTLDWAAYGELRSIHRAPAGGPSAFAVTRQGRLLRTNDNGRSWERQLEHLSVRVRGLVCDEQSGHILLATSRGVLAAELPFESWQWQNHGLRQVTVTAACQLPDERILVGTHLGLYAFDGRSREWCSANVSVHASGGEESSVSCNAAKEDPVWRRLSGSIANLDISPCYEGGWCLAVAGEEGVVACRFPEPHAEMLWRAVGPRRTASSVKVRPDGSLWATGVGASGVWLGHAPDVQTWDLEDVVLERTGGEEPPTCAPRFLSTDTSADAPILLCSGEAWVIGSDEIRSWDLPGGGRPLSGWSGEALSYVGTDRGLFLQAGDERWKAAGFGGDRILDLRAALHDPETMLCRTSEAVFWSRGVTWSLSRQPVSEGSRRWESVPLPPELTVTFAALSPDGKSVLLGTQLGLFLVQPPEDKLLILEPRPIVVSPNPFSQQVQLRCRLDEVRFLDLNQVSTGTNTHEVEEPANLERESQDVQRRHEDSGLMAEIHANGAEAGLEGPPRLSAAGEEVAEFGEPGAQSIQSARAEIRIFSVHGQLVRRLVGAEAQIDETGTTVLQWNWDGRTEHGQEAPNGIYMLSTRLGPQSYVGKLVKFR